MSFRHTQILERARQDGKVTVDGLANTFDVTLQTIRRDLTELAEQGRLERVHGGAVLPSGITNRIKNNSQIYSIPFSYITFCITYCDSG